MFNIIIKYCLYVCFLFISPLTGGRGIIFPSAHILTVSFQPVQFRPCDRCKGLAMFSFDSDVTSLPECPIKGGSLRQTSHLRTRNHNLLGKEEEGRSTRYGSLRGNDNGPEPGYPIRSDPSRAEPVGGQI